MRGILRYRRATSNIGSKSPINIFITSLFFFFFLLWLWTERWCCSRTTYTIRRNDWLLIWTKQQWLGISLDCVYYNSGFIRDRFMRFWRTRVGPASSKRCVHTEPDFLFTHQKERLLWFFEDLRTLFCFDKNSPKTGIWISSAWKRMYCDRLLALYLYWRLRRRRKRVENW